MSQALLALPAAPRAAGLARAHVRTCLREWRLEHLRDSAELLVSELVTNALVHAGGGLAVCVERLPDGVRVQVADGSAVGPVRRRHSATSATGRGVPLLDELTDTWGWQPERGGGKTVWFVLTQDRL